MQEMWVPSLGQEGPLEEEWQLTPVCLEIPWTEESGGLQSMGSQSDMTAHAHNSFSKSYILSELKLGFVKNEIHHSVQFSHSIVSDSLQPHEPQHIRPPCLSPTSGVHPNPMSIESVMPSNHLILCRPLPLLPSIFPSITVFSNESTLPIRWPKYWSFSFNISPFNEHPGLISFRMDWLDLTCFLRNLYAGQEATVRTGHGTTDYSK